MGVEVGVHTSHAQRLDWADEALDKAGHKREITVFTRHYQAVMLLAEQKRFGGNYPEQSKNSSVVIKEPPLEIPPLELKMAWSSLVQNNSAHQWLRRLIAEVAKAVD